MKTIELKEIEKLYSAYHVKFAENHSIRNALNEGTMNKKLNEGTLNKKPAYRDVRGDYYG
jgi:hypothetical protein